LRVRGIVDHDVVLALDALRLIDRQPPALADFDLLRVTVPIQILVSGAALKRVAVLHNRFLNLL
jgi:hypothetical protein